MALTRGFVTNGATTALDTRFMEQSKLIKNLDNSVRTGMIWGNAGAVTGTSSMNVVLGDGNAWVLSRGVNDGAILLWNYGALNIPVTAPTANSWYAVVYIKQDDNTAGDPDSLPVAAVVYGSAAASPSIPAVPTGALALATVLIASTATTTNGAGVTIANTYQFTGPQGTPIRYRSYSDLQADIGNVVSGNFGYVKDNGIYYARIGVWRRLDETAFVSVNQTTGTTIATGTSAGTLGGTNPNYGTSDPAIFPTRTDGVVGPMPYTCWVEASGGIGFSVNSTGNRYLEIMQNDSSLVPPVAEQLPASSLNGTPISISGVFQVQAGDYIKLKGWQNSGGSLNYQSRLVVKLIRLS